MKLIYPYGADKIYLGNPVELFRDQDTGDYIIPENATDIPPELNGEGMWRPMFNEEKQTWIETADQAYKKSLLKDVPSESNPTNDQLSALGKQLTEEKLARIQADQAQKALGMQLTEEVIARKEAEALSQSLGKQIAALKLDLLNLKGEMTSES